MEDYSPKHDALLPRVRKLSNPSPPSVGGVGYTPCSSPTSLSRQLSRGDANAGRARTPAVLSFRSKAAAAAAAAALAASPATLRGLSAGDWSSSASSTVTSAEPFSRTQRLMREDTVANRAARMQRNAVLSPNALKKSDPHLVRLSPIGKTYVTIRNFRIAEAKFSRADVDELKGRLASEVDRSSILEAQLEEVKEAFLDFDEHQALKTKVAALEERLRESERTNGMSGMKAVKDSEEDDEDYSSSDDDDEWGNDGDAGYKKKRKGGVTKRNKKPVAKAMSHMMGHVIMDPKSPLRQKGDGACIEDLKRTMCNIIEKKAEQEKTDERVQGHMLPTSALAEFTEDFFLRTYGLPKIAKRELVKQMTCLDVHRRSDDKKIRMMAILVGIENPEVYSLKISHVFMRILRKVFPDTKRIAERLAKNGERIPRVTAEMAVLRGDLESPVHRLRDFPEKWVAPHLLSVGTPKEIVAGLIGKFDALPSKVVDDTDTFELDDVFWAILKFVQERADVHTTKIHSVFHSFGLNFGSVKSGKAMDYDSFMNVADYCAVCQHLTATANAGGSLVVARRRRLAYAPLNIMTVMKIFKRIHEILELADDDAAGSLDHLIYMCCYQGGMYLPPSQAVPTISDAEEFLAAKAEAGELFVGGRR